MNKLKTFIELLKDFPVMLGSFGAACFLVGALLF